MNKQDIDRIEQLLRNEETLEAMETFNKLETEETAIYFLLKGKIAQKFQQWSDALNAYHRVLELDPGNGEAVNNIHLIKNILNFWSPEMFNP